MCYNKTVGEEGTRLRLKELEHAGEGQEQCALDDGALRMVSRAGIVGLVMRLHPVEVIDHDADARSVELGVCPIVSKISPVFERRGGAVSSESNAVVGLVGSEEGL
jgi:hypothetical protein